MSGSSPSMYQQLPEESVIRHEQEIMGRAFRTPSPPMELQLSSIERSPDTPGELAILPYGNLRSSSQTLYKSCPRTPPSKTIEASWLGFPTPQSPADYLQLSTTPSPAHTYDDNDLEKNEQAAWTSECVERRSPKMSPLTSRSVSVPSSSIAEDNQSPSSLSIENGAHLASQMSVSYSVRRSTRLKNQTKIHEKDVVHRPAKLMRERKALVAATPPPPQQKALPELTQAEPTTSPFEVVIAPNSDMPGLHSTEWQLMYPPGGSTHPAYPWPTSDPRLIFQSHQVPLSNGLPDVSYAPALLLPPGWRQVCWSGLHPVVFDPHHQGFKLTAVGPIPLTCEEVHQGGLKDYVPGGRSHPEFGLLPLLSNFSDGSDSEVFNFEGVDWRLPWAHIEGDHALELATTMRQHDSTFSSSIASTHVAIEVPPHHVEGRDCPDDVIDLEDAWRWLRDWTDGSTTTFQASPGKDWRGTGIPLTARTVKQPIASLMALTMADEEPNADPYLLKQARREFCPFRSIATPVHVDITLLKDVEFTIVELLSYFPWHYQWRGGAHRLVRSGMSSSDIANFVNMVRRLPAGSLSNSSTVNGYLYFDRDGDGNRVRSEPPLDSEACYTAEDWSNDVWEKTDYPLLGLAIGLKTLPSDADAGPLTTLIEWCREHKRSKVMLSHVPVLLQEAGISTLIEPGRTTDPDREVIIRHGEAMKKDRHRVLKGIKLLKEKKEAEKEELEIVRVNRPKRRRLG